MRVLIWGFGNYYHLKKEFILTDSIIAFVSGKESGSYEGVEIIDPKAVFQYTFDRLYIMTGLKAVFEILSELRELGYQEWDKIAFGLNLGTPVGEEKLLLEDGRIECSSEGKCIYTSGCEGVELSSEKDWNQLKQKKVREKYKNEMARIPLKPISDVFGLDRGLPIDRYYIESFLKENSRHIKGVILEVAGREYTMKYGTDIEKSYCMHVCNANGENSIVANLETGEGIIDGLADCFILTQTLPCIFDVVSAAQNVVRFLKDGGTALVTVSGITQISRYDMDRWGHYWSFTTASLKKIFEACEEVEHIEVKAHGNVKSAVSGLYGLAVEDMKPEDLTYQDDDYQQIITAVVRKRCKESFI